MWHEARKQEKKIRDIMVNYKKRAERRQAFYERMKMDPTIFLRVQGSSCKIHIGRQTDDTNMMPWQGDKSIMIDRFDARANLDYIPERLFPQVEISSSEEKKLNYERYRTLVMIEASGATEEGYLKQLQFEEENPRADVSDKKEKLTPKASIGYSYQNSDLVMDDNESNVESDNESDLDLDIDIAVNVDELDEDQTEELDKLAVKFGMEAGNYCRLLKGDKDEAELVQKVKDEEEARSQLRGRRAKRDRRSMKERQRGTMSTSPLSYLRRSSPSYDPYESRSRSRSRSSSSESEPNAVEFITEFGSQSSIDTSTQKKSDKTKKHRSHDSEKKSESRKSNRSNLTEMARRHDYKRSESNPSSRSRQSYRSRSRSRSRSPSYTRKSYRRSRSRSRESYERNDGYRRSRSRSRSRSRERSSNDKRKDYDSKAPETKPKSSLPANKPKLTPQEKLKKRMQIALNKQMKIDKKEERKKRDEKELEKQERDDNLREVSRRWKDRYYE